MAFKMRENYQKTTSIAEKPPSSSIANVYINRVGRAVTLTIAPISQKYNQEKLYKDSGIIQNIQGIFCWKSIAKYFIPYIIFVMNGEELKIISVRIAKTQQLSNYLH